MTAHGNISLDQWRELSERVGGSLFRDPLKLEAMRSVDRVCGSNVHWEDFCGLVEAKIFGALAFAPTKAGKEITAASLPYPNSH